MEQPGQDPREMVAPTPLAGSLLSPLPHTRPPCRALLLQGTFGREPSAAKPEDDRYLRAAIQEYDNIAKLGQIMREGPIKVSGPHRRAPLTKGLPSFFFPALASRCRTGG